MKIFTFEQKSDEWHAWRDGCITSTDAKSLVGTKSLLKAELVEMAIQAGLPEEVSKLKVEDLQKEILKVKPDASFEKFITKDNDTLYYKILAHQLSNGTAPTDERAMDRGNRLEPEIRKEFNETYDRKFIEVGGCSRDDDERIGMSPDGIEVTVTGKTHGLEIKALAGWKHVKAWQEDSIPEEHMPQVIQYFVTDDNMEKLYFVMGCPEITVKPTLVFEIHREDIEKEIQISLQAQKELLAKVDNKLIEIYQ